MNFNNITYIYFLHRGNEIPFYVGKTTLKNRSQRITDHKVRFGSNIYFEILEEIESLDKKQWKPLECYWISQFKTWGFKLENQNGGGGGPVTFSHKKETKDKIRNSLKGKIKGNTSIRTKETLKKQSLAAIGKPKPQGFGKIISNNKERSIKLSKPVLQYDLKGNFIKEWPGASIAGRELSIEPNGITNCCRKNQSNSGGYLWRFKNNLT